MDIYLVRHTNTDTPNGLCYGQTDVPLALSFTAEAKAITRKLPDLTNACRVYSSPLARCRQLAQTFNLPVEIDSRLVELDFGAWENRLFDDIDTNELSQWTQNFVTLPPPGGETFIELCARADQFWNGLISLPSSEPAVVVTHAGFIRALIANILQLPPANVFKLKIDTGSVSKLRYINSYTYIDYINR